MIKVIKVNKNKFDLEIKGSTHDLYCEFNAVLKAMYEVLDSSLVKSAPFTVEGLLHRMVTNIAAEEEEEK